MNLFLRFPRSLRWLTALLAIWLGGMTLYRLWFHAQFHPVGNPLSLSAIWLGFRFDLKFAAILGVVLLVLLAIQPLNPFRYYHRRSWWAVLCTIITLVLTLFYAADYFHYDYLRQRLVASVLSYTEDATISAAMVWQTYPVVWVTLGLLLLIGLCYVLLIELITHFQTKPTSPTAWSGWYIIYFLLLGMSIFGKFGQFNLRWSDAFLLNDAYKSQLALNPLQSFFSTLKYRAIRPQPADVQPYYAFMANYLGVDQPDSNRLNFARTIAPTPTPLRYNVVLVIAESFSMYKSTMSGNKYNTTPYFDSLSKQGVFFERCYTPSFPTARGVWATVTSLPDVLGDNNRTASRNPEVVDQHTIINDFKDYAKSYFLGGDPTWANIKGLLMGNIHGLTLYAQDSFRAEKLNVWGIDDKNLFLEANSILEQQKQPFFGIIQTADNHRPYTIPEADLKVFQLDHQPVDSLRAWGFESNEEYNAFRYTDFCFQQFMEKAKRSPYFDNTIFVFVGDHGIPGDARRVYPEAFTDAALTRVHVPLLFYAPKLMKPVRYSEAVSQLDILPSLAGCMGIGYRNNALGKNLFDSTQRKRSEAFIIDHEAHTIGMVNQDYYYYEQQKTGRAFLVSLKNNLPVPADQRTEAVRQRLKQLTHAFYQTARYLLYHNPKPSLPQP